MFVLCRWVAGRVVKGMWRGWLVVIFGAVMVGDVTLGAVLVGSSFLVVVCWWQFVGGSSLVVVCWWPMVGSSLLVAVCWWQWPDLCVFVLLVP